MLSRYQDKSSLDKFAIEKHGGSPLKAEHFLSKGYKAMKASGESRNLGKTYRATNLGDRFHNTKDLLSQNGLMQSKTLETLPAMQAGGVDGLPKAPSKYHMSMTKP